MNRIIPALTVAVPLALLATACSEEAAPPQTQVDTPVEQRMDSNTTQPLPVAGMQAEQEEQAKVNQALEQAEDHLDPEIAEHRDRMEQTMQTWKDRIDTYQARVSNQSGEAQSQALAAWADLQAKWSNLKVASAEQWQDAKGAFDTSLARLEDNWDEAAAMTEQAAMETTETAADSFEQIKAHYQQEVEPRMAIWSRKLDQYQAQAAEQTEAAAEQTEDAVQSAWNEVQSRWHALQEASEDNWQDAKASFNEAMDHLQQQWDQVTDEQPKA